MDFASLPPDVQEAVREKQRQAKESKKSAKPDKPKNGDVGTGTDCDCNDKYPSRISKNEYFGACRGGLFRDEQLKPTEFNLELVLSALAAGDEQAKSLGTCNYFQFCGSEKEVWDPTFNARLAWEGFFTITTGRRRISEPLPELQPFYGVVTWPNFEASKHVRKALRRIHDSGCRYELANCKDPARTWELLNKYHLKKYGSNWLTDKYFAMLRLGSDNRAINFKMHCIELYAAGESASETANKVNPLAGEIGFSVGHVYTSLSGWTEERTSDGLGFAQLVLLGKWLQLRGYQFWSLGHCYSPEMDYKRELGHRIYPRVEFLALLKEHRGAFLQKDAAPVEPVADGKSSELFRALAEGDSCDSDWLLEYV